LQAILSGWPRDGFMDVIHAHLELLYCCSCSDDMRRIDYEKIKCPQFGNSSIVDLGLCSDKYADYDGWLIHGFQVLFLLGMRLCCLSGDAARSRPLIF
jgi:hypothetical protein